MGWAATPSAVGSVVYTAAGGTLNATLSGYAVGHWIFLATGEGPGSDTLATPGGWTLFSPASRAKQLALFGIRATSTSMTIPGVQWSTGAFNQAWAVAFSWAGGPTSATGMVDGASDIETTSTTTTGQTFAAFTPTGAGRLVLCIGTKVKTSASNGATFTPPGGFTNLIVNVPAGGATVAYVAYQVQNTAAAVPVTGAAASIADATAQATEGAKVALVPGVGGGSGIQVYQSLMGMGQ